MIQGLTNKHPLKPINGLVLVLKEDVLKDSSIIILDKYKEDANIGTVIDTGKGRKLNNGKIDEMPVKKGDKIIFGKCVGKDLGDGYMVMNDFEILAVVESDKKKKKGKEKNE